MRILHLLSSTGYHGAENMAAELIRQLNRLGIKNYLGIFHQNEKSNADILNIIDDFIEDGVVFPCNGKLDMKTIFLLRKYIKANQISIIHSHKYKTNLYLLFASLGIKCRLVSTCHNWLGGSLKMRFYALLDKQVLKAFDTIVGVSNEVTEELKRFVDIRKVQNIGNGVDITKYFPLKIKNEAKKIIGLENKTVIGFVGRLSAEKGISYLLKAISRIVEQRKDVYALIVGDGDNFTELKEEAQLMGLNNRVIFTGNRSDTPLIYQALDVFVLPSLIEAFPMVVLEAMACGVPVVATRVGDIPRIIEDNVTGLLTEKENVEGLFSSIDEILMNNVKAKQMGEAGSNKVKKYFSSTAMAKKYLSIYQQL